MKKYIRSLAALLGAFVLAIALVGCGGGSSSAPADEKPTEEVEQAQTAEETTEQEEEAESEEAPAAESPYVVTIDGAETSTDYDGNPAIIVTYTFTNNAEEATSFWVALSTEVYQDGVQLEQTYVEGMDSDAEMKNIKTGASIEVQVAYALDSTSEVEVEVYELFDFDHEMLASQTFSVE